MKGKDFEAVLLGYSDHKRAAWTYGLQTSVLPDVDVKIQFPGPAQSIFMY